MKPFNYKILNLIVFSTLLIFYTVFAKASVETYSVFAKLPLLGEVQVQNIETSFTIINNEFDYSYNVEPTKLVDFFDNKISNGYIKGIFKNEEIHPQLYFYHSKKDDFERSIKFNYLDGKITDIKIEPLTIGKKKKKILGLLPGSELAEKLINLLNFEIETINKLLWLYKP